jgi:alkanesulfonate monooxygenase SsuD/methylene tetrahydromethanopterin reductase-like flavin-dependent oxidoreductase (luciferase family)
MHCGIFLEESRRGTSQGAALQETLELAEAAEAWGLDGVWLGEIHFTPARSVLAAPIAVASFIAARTRRVRLGTAVQVLPLGNPLRIAEEVATLDHLSQGRFDFGVGRSGAARTYDVLGIPYGESQARFLEALEIIRKAWTEDTFSYEGKFHRFQDATVAPRPYQHPHPPIRMAANTPETFSVVGQLGLGILVGTRDLDVPELRVHLQSYRQGWRDAGHPGRAEVYLRIPVYAGSTEKRAAEEPQETVMSLFERQVASMRSGIGRPGAGPAEWRRARAERLAATSYGEILKTRVAFGTPAGLIERFAGLREELGLAGLIAEPNPGGLLAMNQVRRSLHILAQEVMPAIK